MKTFNFFDLHLPRKTGHTTYIAECVINNPNVAVCFKNQSNIDAFLATLADKTTPDNYNRIINIVEFITTSGICTSPLFNLIEVPLLFDNSCFNN